MSYHICYFTFLCVESVSLPYPWRVLSVDMSYVGIIDPNMQVPYTITIQKKKESTLYHCFT